MGRYDQVREKKPAGVIVFIVMILIILAGGGWFYFNKLKQNDDAVTGTRELKLPLAPEIMRTDELVSENNSIEDEIIPDIEEVESVAPDQLDLEFILPELLDSDGLFRKAMTMVSPGLAPWLSSDQLIRKYVLIANDFSQGLRLEKHMRFLKQAQPFTVEQTDNGLFISSQSYQRYDKLAEAINTMDVQSTLTVYKKFRPLLLKVFAEFSYPPEYSLEDVFMKAAAEILSAPIIEEPIALVRPSVLYKFADKNLEASSPVKKQMIRMGPRNTRIIQNKIRLLIQELSYMKE